MPIDPRIPLAVQPPSWGQNFQSDMLQFQQQRQDAPIRQRLLEAQTTNAELQNTAAKQKQLNDEETSVIMGSAAVQQYLGRNDVAGAKAYLSQRKAQLQNLGLNTSHTDQALALIDQDPNQLKTMVDSNVELGTRLGLFGKAATPTNEQQNLEALGYRPGTPEYAKAFQQTYGKPDPNTITAYQQAQLDVDRQKLDIDRAKLNQGPEGDKTFKQATELRKEFIAQSKDYSLQNDALGRIAAAAKDPSAAGDIALIFSFMKMNDPTSTVREGEYATAANAGGVPDRIVSVYNKVLSGERLAPAQRADFVKKSGDLFNESKKQHQKREREYTRLAKQNNLNPEDVIVDFSTYQPEAEGAPPGTQQGVQEGATATNPQTGEKIIFRNGQWQKM